MQAVERAHGRQPELLAQAPVKAQGNHEFAFSTPQYSPFHHVHTASFPNPNSPSQVGGHFFYSTPSPLSPTMPHTQHPFPQFDVPMRSTLPTMQFLPLFQVPGTPSLLPHPRSTQN
jgi:hypothetical protein